MSGYQKFSAKFSTTTPKPERTVIAATPGWYVAFYFPRGDNGREGFHLEPVIGWAVTLDVLDGPRHGRMYIKHEIEPLLVGETVHKSGYLIERPWALKRPDGLFQLLEGGCGTEKDVMDWFRKEDQRLNGPMPPVK